eukprot:Tamp_28354.p1 GENE.Tamp_28354~~Tamp_28354.p1  ORF type:complete len:154 (-),score=5.28 Tamp_28354:251-712(-)
MRRAVCGLVVGCCALVLCLRGGKGEKAALGAKGERGADGACACVWSSPVPVCTAWPAPIACPLAPPGALPRRSRTEPPSRSLSAEAGSQLVRAVGARADFGPITGGEHRALVERATGELSAGMCGSSLAIALRSIGFTRLLSVRASQQAAQTR